MKAFLVSNYLCSSVDNTFAFNDLCTFADKYSLCGQGVIMGLARILHKGGLATVIGEDPIKNTI